MASNVGTLTATAHMKFNYTQQEVNATKYQVKQEVIDSIESSPEMRKEISRTFQTANRRIQNIQKAGALSPAVESLGLGNSSTYSKFSLSGKSWETLKADYAKATTFLQQPTSTLRGARAWETQVCNQLGIDKDFFRSIADDILHDYNTVLGNAGKVKYEDMLQDIYDRAIETSGNQMERDAVEFANEVQSDIEKEATQIAGDAVDKVIKELEDAFNM